MPKTRSRIWLLATVALTTAWAHAYAEDDVRLFLPPTLYAVPGTEANVYFDNITLTLNPANYAFDVTCPKGIQQVERWTYTPTGEEGGAIPFKLEVRSQSNQVLGSAESQIAVAPDNAGAGKEVSLLLIGDSLTHASVYSVRLLELCHGEGQPKLKLIGSHLPKAGQPENRHEGYGGWTAKRFTTHYTGVARTGSAKERGSPFLYAAEDDAPRLDFARYCAEVNGGEAPDFVTIFLGCNDIFNVPEDGLEPAIDEIFTHFDTLVTMVRESGPATQVGLIAPVPPAATQDAFGANYACGSTRWQYKRKQHRMVERMYERYGNGQSEGVSLIPAFVNLDCLANYPTKTAPRNAHSTVEETRLNNGVHPAAEGYRQIGDSVYAWLKAKLAE